MHDSPDYYKLKCSVFNDDKKTDLIGEAWIDLTAVVVPGGGQNDLWHQLQFKGRYAGDVRMELTYYDTRPKDGMLLERRRDKEKTEHSRVNSSSGGSGPRRLGPREVKRRPLPTNPSTSASGERPPPPEQVHSAPLPQLPQSNTTHNLPQNYDDQFGPDSHYHVLNSTENSSYPEPVSQDRLDHGPSASNNEYGQPQGALHSNFSCRSSSGYGNLDHPGELPESDGFSFHSAQSSIPVTPAQSSHHPSFAPERRNSAQSSGPPINRSSTYPVSAPYGSSPPAFGHDRSAPGSNDYQNQASFRRYSTSPSKNDVFRDSPLRQSISHHDVEPAIQPQYDLSEDEGPPPLPPAHRSNMRASTSPPNPHQDMQAMQIPRPLTLGSSNLRVSPFDRSPLQRIERNCDPEYQSCTHSPPPSAEKGNTYSSYSRPTYSAAAHRAGGKSYDRPISGIENTPPSLRSGYGRGVEETEDFWMQDERQASRQPFIHAESPCDQDTSTHDNGHAPYQLPRIEDEQQMFTSETRFVRRRATSPNPQSFAKRKAVTPQPVNTEGERSLTAVPFGPDAYEVFNPSSPLTSSVAGAENRYESPEQAKEAARQHEVQKLRDQGPIIGNDGRVIDPSDHLPTDTWAPEPERKNRKPEMVIRYKSKETNPRTPQGCGSSPGSVRPHSVAGAVYGSSPLAAQSPASLAQQNLVRIRPQQLSGRPLPAQSYQQTHSSPVVPTNLHNTPSPRSNHAPRPDLSEYPLYGHPDQRNSHGGIHGGPPLIPAGVPSTTIGSNERYAGYGGMDALSAELSTIDIGTGISGKGSRTGRGYGL